MTDRISKLEQRVSELESINKKRMYLLEKSKPTPEATPTIHFCGTNDFPETLGKDVSCTDIVGFIRQSDKGKVTHEKSYAMGWWDAMSKVGKSGDCVAIDRKVAEKWCSACEENGRIGKNCRMMLDALRSALERKI